MDGGLESPKGPAPAPLVLAIRAHERAKSRGEEEGGGKRALGSRGVVGILFSNIGEQAGLEQLCVWPLKPAVSFFCHPWQGSRIQDPFRGIRAQSIQFGALRGS